MDSTTVKFMETQSLEGERNGKMVVKWQKVSVICGKLSSRDLMYNNVTIVSNNVLYT
jgi:hypothetical protein